MSQEIDSSIVITLIWLGYLYWHVLNERHLPPPGQDSAEYKQTLAPPGPPKAHHMADVATLPGVNATGAAGRASALANALSLAEQRDRSFRAASFLEGASRAYEDISIAFAAGDRELLRNLVSPEVFDDFDAVIEDRERRGERTQATFVQIAPPLIVGAELRDGQTQISIRFAGELLTAMPAPNSELYRSNTVLDIWTFAKPTASHDPAWRLIATNLPDVGTGIHRQPWTVQ